VSQLSANTGRRRGKGRPFVKGQSGNPGGRLRAPLDVQELARAHTKEAVLALVQALDDPRHAVSAAVALLDRGWGRPTQHIAGDADAGPTHYTFSWGPATPEPQPEAPLVVDAPTDAGDLTRSDAPRPLTLAWNAAETC
jgi:hypothetical protein